VEGACRATLRTLDWTDSNIPGPDEGELTPGAEAAPLGGLRPEEALLNLDLSNSAALGSLKRRSFATRDPEMIGNHSCFDLLRWTLSAAPRSAELWITERPTTRELDFDRCLG
jgi:hypothetical protein